MCFDPCVTSTTPVEFDVAHDESFDSRTQGYLLSGVTMSIVFSITLPVTFTPVLTTAPVTDMAAPAVIDRQERDTQFVGRRKDRLRAARSIQRRTTP